MSGRLLCHHSKDKVWQMICNLNFWSKPTVLLIFVNTDVKCSSKLNFESNIIHKCLWIVVTLTILLLNIRPGWFLCKFLRLNMVSWACFVGSVLKLIFHCRAHVFILERSLFNRLAETVILWTTENSDVSSAKNLTFEFKPLGKSLM